MALKKQIKKASRKVRGAVASVISAPSRVKSAVRGRVADHKRGKLLAKRGFRPARRSGTFGSMARAGTQNLKKK